MVDNKEINIHSVMDLIYMKRVSTSLYFMGAWPYAAMGIKKEPIPLRSTTAMCTLWFCLLLSGIAYVKENMYVLSFFEMGHNYITVFMNCVFLQRLTVGFMKSYGEATNDFVTKIHLLYFKHKSDYAMKVHLQVDKICTNFMKVLYVQMIIGVMFFNFTPLFNNYRHGMFSSNKPLNGTYEHSVYFKLPFDYSHSFTGFLLMNVTNWILSFDCSSGFVIFDLYLSIIIFHLWGHLRILKNNIETFPRPKINESTNNSIENPPMYTEEESEQVTVLLSDCINYHRMIKKFMSLMSDGFGPSIVVCYTFNQVAECILLLECSEMSETLKDVVYGLPWESMNTKNRKILLFYLYNVQEPLNMKVLGVVPVGVQTMAAILKTSVSYFMLLRAFTTEE